MHRKAKCSFCSRPIEFLDVVFSGRFGMYRWSLICQHCSTRNTTTALSTSLCFVVALLTSALIVFSIIASEIPGLVIALILYLLLQRVVVGTYLPYARVVGA
jgi:hypothetical protein